MKYVFFDVEATCWTGYVLHDQQEIIEIAGIVLDEYWDELDRFQYYIRPQLNTILSSYCRNLTSITQKQVDHAHIFEKVFSHLESDLHHYDNEFCLVSWGAFDRKILRYELERSNYDLTLDLYHMDLAEDYSRLKRLNRVNSLAQVLEDENIEMSGNAHSALDDSVNLLAIFRKLMGQWGMEHMVQV